MSGDLDWFSVADTNQFFVGEPLNITGVSSGYERSLDYARGLLDRPHDRFNRDLLTAECNELAAMFIEIAKEDGNALSLGAALRAMMLEAARTSEPAWGVEQ
jgi:hypothetical protein